MESTHPLIAKYVNDDWSINWPADPTERSELARLVLGAWLVGDTDYWIKFAQDLIEQPEPQQPYVRKNKAFEKDKAYRDSLSTLSTEQKETCLRLIREVTNGVLFSTLVTFDQFKYGKIALQLVLDLDDDCPQEIVKIAPTHNDLHDDLFEWIELFSDFAAEFRQDTGAIAVQA